MRVLVATHDTNGQVPGDYDFCIEGELVYVQDPCDRDLRDPDGGCGCSRGFAGMNSHRACTTAKVVERDLSEADVREALRSSLAAGGWLDPDVCTAEEAMVVVGEMVREVRFVAERLPEGSIVRRRLDLFTSTPAGG
jgi:hypothetical protein